MGRGCKDSLDKHLNNDGKRKNNKEYDYSMVAEETIGALIVLVCGLIIYFGIQFLGNIGIGPFGIPFSYYGLGLIALGVFLIVWYVRTRL